MAAASGLNIALDLIFVLVFQMGTAGAAWATVIAQVAAMVGSIWFGMKKNPYLKLEKRHFCFEKGILKDSLRLGLPIAAQNAMIAFSCVALQSVVNRYGAVVMAAYTATSRVEQLVQQPFGSLGTAVSTFAGQNIGAGRYDRVSAGCKVSAGIVVIFSLIMVAVMFLFGNGIVRLFVNESEVVSIGAKGLQITSLMYIGLGLIYVTRGILNGAGDAAFAMANGVTEVIGRVGFAWLMMMLPAVGIWGVWYANGLTWALTGAVNVVRVLQGKWKTKSVIGMAQFSRGNINKPNAG